MYKFLLCFLFLLPCVSAYSQENNEQKEIHERAKEWQERMNHVRNRGEAQRPNTPHFGRPHLPPPNFNGWQHPGFRPPVGYFPVVQWYPYGTWMNVGPVVVSPDRRYVRFGINAGFSEYRGFDTFNFYNGETRNYRR